MAAILSKTSILCRTVFHKKLISGPITKIKLVRNCKHLTNRTNFRAEQRFKLKDNISNDYRLVYREQKAIELVVIFSYNGGLVGLALGTFIAAYLIYKDPPITGKEVKGAYGTLKPLTKTGRTIFLIGGFFISFMLIIISRTLPFRIYHSPSQKMYKMIVVDNIFRGSKTLTFGEGTATLKYKRTEIGAFYNIDGRIILLDNDSFPVEHTLQQMIRKTD